MKPGPGLLSQTFTASTSAIIAAGVVLQELLSPALFGPDGGNMQVHARFVRRFEAMARRIRRGCAGRMGWGGWSLSQHLKGRRRR